MKFVRLTGLDDRACYVSPGHVAALIPLADETRQGTSIVVVGQTPMLVRESAQQIMALIAKVGVPAR